MSLFDSCEILKLAELLQPPKNDNSDDEQDEIGRPAIKDFAQQDLKQNGSVDKCKEEISNKIKNENEEVPDPEEDALRYLENENFEANDWRKTAQWDITYRQQVTPSDLFLGMGCKTPATASCENMIVTVHLPGEKRQNVDLKVTCERLQLLSPRFRLDIPLPHPVDPQKGNAQFDSESEKLVITLQLNREFDYVNF